MARRRKMHNGDKITQRWLAEERAAKVKAELDAVRAAQLREWERAHWAAGNPADLDYGPDANDADW